MKPDRHPGGTGPALALGPGKSEAQGMKTARSKWYFSHLEAMPVDGQQPEQSPSHFLWTSVKYESKVSDVPESCSFTQGEQPIRIPC